ncbi:LysR family transcriptional regulator [Marivivens niveibacter]|uniref:LysR family transcriptional regulator n=1 Tax=Marivivens niveibacter TaxID=1930667 RepID=A0A251WY87_9RHOB|nr:LysR family transcriptional regulator [Marivivens niveibacter]OUD09261.1 LysR family transcriptional regulator [Marivivens niveibacter]
MIDKLEMFIALSRIRHFGRAAEELGITQPSLSAGIKQLESQLGVQLVNRGSRFGGLTTEGERALEWALRIVGDTRTFKQEMRSSKKGLSGEIKLAVIPTALPMVADLTEKFYAKHPNVRFSILSQSSAGMQAMMDNLQIDAGITYLDHAPLGRVKTVPLFDEDYAVICHKDAPLAQNATIQWAELAQENLCLLTPNMQNRQIIDQMLIAAGVTPTPTVQSNSTVVLASHVETGRWVTVLPTHMAEFLTTGRPIVQIALKGSQTQRVGLIVPDRDPLPPLTNALLGLAHSF